MSIKIGKFPYNMQSHTIALESEVMWRALIDGMFAQNLQL